MSTPTKPAQNRYSQLMEHIFLAGYVPKATTIAFTRSDLERAAQALRIKLPKNLGDVIYSFRYRNDLPKAIKEKAPKGRSWIIRGTGRAKYAFVAVDTAGTSIRPSVGRSETKIPDATPGVIVMHALNDEQALLAIVRYNRLIDVFTGVACYSLQSHLRTTAPGVGQIETDEVYVGLDKHGAHYVFPVQAKGGKDRLHIVQIEQDYQMCAAKFPQSICRAIAAQFMGENLIALFEFEKGREGVTVVAEAQYRLVPPDELEPEELEAYARRTARPRLAR